MAVNTTQKNLPNLYPVIESATAKNQFPIRPENIDTSRKFDDVFKDPRLAITAENLMMFFQAMGYWSTFRREELKFFYQVRKLDLQNMVLEPRIGIVEMKRGEFAVTEYFILLCARQIRQ